LGLVDMAYRHLRARRAMKSFEDWLAERLSAMIAAFVASLLHDDVLVCCRGRGDSGCAVAWVGDRVGAGRAGHRDIGQSRAAGP
jgi:hypothetical protein